MVGCGRGGVGDAVGVVGGLLDGIDGVGAGFGVVVVGFFGLFFGSGCLDGGRLDGGLNGAAGFGFGGAGRKRPCTEEETLGHRVVELVGIAGEIDVVEAKDAEEVADARDVPVGDFRLECMTDFFAEKPLPVFSNFKGPLEDWRADINGDFGIGAIYRIGDFDWRCVGGEGIVRVP